MASAKTEGVIGCLEVDIVSWRDDGLSREMWKVEVASMGECDDGGEEVYVGVESCAKL